MSLRAALKDQAISCAFLGSPFMERLLTLLSDRLAPDHPIAERLFAWPGDITSRGDSVPLRLAGGLHALVLAKPDSALAQAYPPNPVTDGALWDAVDTALRTEQRFFQDWLNTPPQTNEVRRSAALIPAAHWLAHRFGLPFALSELGASMGLNLMFDRFALEIETDHIGADASPVALRPDWAGPTPATAKLEVIDRRGIDLNPLSARDPEDQMRICAFLWADQPDRQELTKAAMACQDAPVDKGDVQNWLPNRLNQDFGSAVHMVYHTVAWQYFPVDVQNQCREMIEAAGRRATLEAPLAWFGMETDNTDKKGAALTLRLWPGDEIHHLGRADFHGRWVDWAMPAP